MKKVRSIYERVKPLHATNRKRLFEQLSTARATSSTIDSLNFPIWVPNIHLLRSKITEPLLAAIAFEKELAICIRKQIIGRTN
jgi:hypothetical protein